jgi:PhnB protein
MTSIAPWLSVDDAIAALAWYRTAFGAIELERLGEGDEVFVAQLSFDGAQFWIQSEPETTPRAIGGASVRMIVIVADPDAAFAKAIAAGATEIAAVHEDHGWRIGRLADPSGHHWELGRRLGE